MGIRFRKSINLGGGARINISKSGIGGSIGTKGARITKTAKGTTRKTISIPNTGISYVKESGSKNKGVKKAAAANTNKPFRLFAIVLRITGILMIVLGALLAFVYLAVGLSSIAIGICELVWANKLIKKHKESVQEL